MLAQTSNNKAKNLRILEFKIFRGKHITVDLTHNHTLIGMVMSVAVFSSPLLALDCLNFKVGLALKNTFLTLLKMKSII